MSGSMRTADVAGKIEKRVTETRIVSDAFDVWDDVFDDVLGYDPDTFDVMRAYRNGGVGGPQARLYGTEKYVRDVVGMNMLEDMGEHGGAIISMNYFVDRNLKQGAIYADAENTSGVIKYEVEENE